ncbi:MptD family putative ECF transporter S component [Hathewaya limosa]|uniref:Energy-coupling factor transport system substrate-specific component n=1 Tax=Hathewaya limosa TaxID=1536 RepID=A0ABU0JP50_HATLI|nr:MptD family putative ECF transporter S component [Hathewaya limosa]MDQ0478843.1 energy-coupling factor transport system substrate-specific component [Hathewaya limosa]
MNNKNLRIKNLVNIGVFSAIFMLISFILMMPAAISPVLWMLYPAIVGIFDGTIYMILASKVQKRGMSLAIGLITGILYAAIGECTWTIVLTFLISGTISEILRHLFGYNTIKGNILSFAALTTGFVGSPLPMWLFHDSYVKSILKLGMDPIYVNKMSNMVSIWSLISMIVAAFIGGLIGANIGKSLLKKHFKKAGIVQ